MDAGDRLMKLILNICAEDGELLEREEIEVSDDKDNPLGSPMAQADIVFTLRSAARVVQARAGIFNDGGDAG
jgi:hypothetical protein